MPSPRGRCSGWLNAAVCSATMCFSASAIISAKLKPTEDRAVHLVLQMPRSLMRYPWELLRDRHGWLVDRFAIGRQVITEAGAPPRWSSNTRQGPLRLLVVAPSVPGNAG